MGWRPPQSLGGSITPVFNVVAGYGADNTGATEASSEIQEAIDAASAAGGGIVFLPKGTYKVSTPITPASNVSIIGAGPGATILMGYGAGQVFYWNGSSSNILVNATFADFEIDGSNQSNGGVYTSAMKGIQVLFGQRVVYRNLYIHDTGATGLGSDYGYECTIAYCVCENCGRLNDGTKAGGAGIGIAVGTIAFPNGENWKIIGCTTNGNGTNGLFFENQSGPTTAYGIEVIGHTSHGNTNHGIADAGCTGLKVIGGRCDGNGGSGFAAYKGSYSGASGPGTQGTIIGLESTNNTAHGIHLDGTNGAPSGYMIKGCRIWQNLTHGILLDNESAAMTGCYILENLIYNNHNTGVFVKLANSKSITDLVIDGNQIRANGLQTGAASNLRAGIRISCAVTQLRIKDNHCWDDQGSKTQTYGLYIDSVTVTSGEIDSNDFNGNLTGAVNSSATYSSFRIGRNNGWTIASGVPSFTAPIGTEYTNLGGSAGSIKYVNTDGSTTWSAYA